MSEPYLAEIRIVGFDFAPRGYASCDGQILPIAQNQALFSLLGTTYGGDGRTTFALPDLRGRAPVHADGSHPLGQKSGEETHSASQSEIPAHAHPAKGSPANADAPVPAGNVLASANNMYGSPTGLTGLHAGTVANAGGGQGHDNMQPFTVLNFVIALQGLFPPRN